jgi:hypothetical protein
MENSKKVIDLSSLDSVMETISVKKKTIKHPEVIETLQFLCKHINPANYNKNMLRAIIANRILMLEDQCTIYIEENQDNLFDLSVEEIDLLKELLD